MNLRLRQLQYFKAIAEMEHYTRAAESLYVSQSSLSHAIQELESELGAKLFVREGRNIRLTKYGKMFLPYVNECLETLETGVAKLNDCIDPSTGTVVMCGLPSMAYFASYIIVRYVSETGRVNVHLQFNQAPTYSSLKSELLSGRADLVFSTLIDDPNVGCTYIGQHPLVLLVSEDHRLAGRDKVYLRELDGEDFIAFDTNCQIREQTDRIFSEQGIHPRITTETAQDLIIYGLVAANHGVAITPYPLGGAPYNVKIVPIADPIEKRELYLMWNKDQYIPPAAEYFRDHIIKSGLVFHDFLQRSERTSGVSPMQLIQE